MFSYMHTLHICKKYTYKWTSRVNGILKFYIVPTYKLDVQILPIRENKK